ncbi:MAG: peptide-methionine (R)-S-oxide reductase MsrB [Bacteroidota bacterium]
MKEDKYPISKTKEEWKGKLTPVEFNILREKGTERAFTGEYWNTKDNGSYHCAGCDTKLFSSDTKYESGCGWPSFWEPLAGDKIKIQMDYSHGMVREEVVCANCGGHLGHRFEDGPEPTGQRYCINSGALDFEKEKND